MHTHSITHYYFKEHHMTKDDMQKKGTENMNDTDRDTRGQTSDIQGEREQDIESRDQKDTSDKDR